MDYRQLHRTELRVSRLCFGTMTFGKPVDQICATSMVDRCINAGINFFDSANQYQYGGAESMLGNALRGKRKEVVLSTKVQHKMGDGPMTADSRNAQFSALLKIVYGAFRRITSISTTCTSQITRFR